MDSLDRKIFGLLAASHPSDQTGFYMLARAFQAHLNGDEHRREECLSIAKKEHLKHVELKEPPSVLVCEDKSIADELIKDVLKDVQKIQVLGGVVERPVFKIHNFQRALLPEELATTDKEYGWYRQFEKKNKRKNFARK